jgi:hypothetical protein
MRRTNWRISLPSGLTAYRPGAPLGRPLPSDRSTTPKTRRLSLTQCTCETSPSVNWAARVALPVPRSKTASPTRLAPRAVVRASWRPEGDNTTSAMSASLKKAAAGGGAACTVVAASTRPATVAAQRLNVSTFSSLRCFVGSGAQHSFQRGADRIR